VSYRDDHEAAVARADALARQLDDERRKREAAEAALAERAEETAALREELDRREPPSPAPTPGPEAEAAARRLEALAARGPQPAPEPVAPAPETRPTDARRSAWARRRRVARSADRFVAMELDTVVPTAFGVGALGGLLTALVLPKPASVIVMFGSYTATFLAVTIGRLTGPWRIRRWIASRPYRLTGLMDALAEPPPSKKRERDGHSELVLHLAFDAAAPPSLTTMIHAFDPAIRWKLTGDGALLHLASPRTEKPRRGDWGRMADHNHAVLQWLRRLDQAVLADLHHAHGLREVAVTLR